MSKKRLNIIDILVVIGIVLAVLFLIKGRAIKDQVVSADRKEVKFVCFVEEEPSDVIDSLSIGDKLFAQYKFQDAEITKIVKEKQKSSIAGSDGILKLVDSYDKYTAFVEVVGMVNYDGPYMQIGGQEVKVGIPYILKTENFAVNTNIVYMEVLD